MPIYDDAFIRRLLDAETIAVVGCSRVPGKAAHEIPGYMIEKGYTVVPVNPNADGIFGREAVDTIGDVDEDIDLVDVFRPSDEVAGIATDVIARHENRGDVDALWLQLGIRDDDAAERVEAAGIDVVQDRCLKVEHRRLVQ